MNAIEVMNNSIDTPYLDIIGKTTDSKLIQILLFSGDLPIKLSFV